MLNILFIAAILVPVCALVICDNKQAFIKEMAAVLNYTKCEGQMDDSSNGSLTLASAITLLDLSGLGIGIQPYDHFSYLRDLEKLVFLNISSNEITSIQDVSLHFPSLEILDLSRNAITVLQTEAFVRTKSLTDLYLAGNGITLIESNAFNDLTRLRSLDLSNNDLLGIQIDTLSGLTGLKYINLANNRIAFIMVGAFSGLNSLETIDLTNNIISAIDKFAFQGAEGLHSIILKENQIKRSSFDFFSTFEQLHSIDLSSNKFHSLETGSFYKVNVSKVVITYMPSLKFIMKKAFSYCPFLDTIDLSQNQQLFYIHSEAFQHVQTKLIDLSNSEIEYLHLKTKNDETMIILSNSKLQCDCVNSDILNNRFPTKGLALSDCRFIDQNDTVMFNSENNTDSFTMCKPKIISKIKPKYSLSVGERHSVGCFAVGIPWPETRWVRVHINNSHAVYENISFSHWLNMHVKTVNQGGTYGCIAFTTHNTISRFLTLKVKSIDVGVVVIARASTSIVITWNKTHHHMRHVILHRAYEDTINYNIQKLNDYWKILKISDLTPATAYEICIGSALDINDRNCIRTSTILFDSVSGIHTDVGVVIVLSVAGLTFSACFIVTLCKCIRKVKAENRGVCMVNSLSREYFGDVKEATFTYENQFTDFVITEDEDKTEF